MTGASRIGRRGLMVGMAGAITAPAIVRADGEYPNRPVRYINPFPAGGPTDTLSRLFCSKMSELSGQQWVVENRAPRFIRPNYVGPHRQFMFIESAVLPLGPDPERVEMLMLFVDFLSKVRR